MTNERTNAELIKAIRDEDKGLGEHSMLSARIIHNTVVTMQVAYLQWKNCNMADEAMVHIEGLLEDTDNIPEEGYAGCGDISNTAIPMVYFRNNHLSGELSPYQSRMAPLIDELERRIDGLHKSLDEARNQKPVAFWWIGPDGKDNGGPYRGKPSDAAIDNARNMGCEPQLLFAGPIHAPSVTDEWRTMMQWLIDQRGKAGHCHAKPGIWDDDNGDKAGQPCEQCAMYDRALAMLQSATVEPNVSTLTLNAADSAQSEQEGMILMPVKADEALVAGFVGCETREEAMLGWDVAVWIQEVRTGKRKLVDPVHFNEAEVIRLQKKLDETREELGKARDRIADRIKDIESPIEVKNPICPRPPVAKCVDGYCAMEAAGRKKCGDDSILFGRPSRAKNLPNGAK